MTFTYSRGRNTFDNRPQQRSAPDLRAFAKALLSDRQAAKGQGYVCSALNSDGRRCAEGALPRNWLPNDIDGVDPATHPEFRMWMARFLGFGWPTASSTPEAPRERIIVVLSREVTRAEGVTLGRLLIADLADEFGADVTVDPCTYRAEQPCYLPVGDVTPFYFEGEPLNVDAWLERAPPVSENGPPDDTGADDWITLLTEGADVHQGALRLVARMVAKGLVDAEIRAWFAGVAGTVAKARGDERARELLGRELDRMIAGARQKYGGQQCGGGTPAAGGAIDSADCAVPDWRATRTGTGRAASAAQLAAVVEAFSAAYLLPDQAQIKIALGAVIANMLPTDPVWVLLLNPPAAGKTESLRPLETLPFCFSAATITEAGLLSGTPKKQRTTGATGGILRQVGPFGIILAKDFTSVLSMNRDARAQVLAALREVFDGHWTRTLGTDGGRSLHWTGKCGFVGAVTNAYDTHASVIASMGDRFLLYRAPVDRTLSRDRARFRLRQLSKEAKARGSVAAQVVALFNAIEIPTELPDLPGKLADQIADVCSLVASARSHVERDGRSREIELVYGEEAPARLAAQLGALWHGLRYAGVDEREAGDLALGMAFDSMPPLRRDALFMLHDKGEIDTLRAAEILLHPKGTVRRALEDLTTHGVIARIASPTGKADYWRLEPWANTILDTVPEMSGHRE